MYLVLLLFALFASLFTLQKETLNYAQPIFLIGIRMTFSGIILLGFAKFNTANNFKLELKSIPSLLLLGIVGIYLTNMFEILGLYNMNSAKACLLYSLSPFISAPLAFLILHEKLSRKKWIGVLIGFLGFIPTIYTQSAEEIVSGKFFIFTTSEIFILGAVICSAYGWIILKKTLNQYNVTPIVANGASMLSGGTIALVHSYLSEEVWQPIPVNNLKMFLFYSLIMCLISNIICYNLYGYLLKRFSATFMSFSGLVTPIFATILGYLFLNEPIDKLYFISSIIFGIGLYLFYSKELAYNLTNTAVK